MKKVYEEYYKIVVNQEVLLKKINICGRSIGFFFLKKKEMKKFGHRILNCQCTVYINSNGNIIDVFF